MASILIVDDDIELSEMLKEYLEREGFAVDTAYEGEAGVTAALSGRYALAVLDVMMPRVNGLEVLRRIRESSSMPVLMLTAKGDNVDRIVGLELGADDYVPKPCVPRELVARIRAILRRSRSLIQEDAASPVGAGPLVMWPEKRSAEWDGAPLDLTSTEFNLLEILVRNAGRAVSKNELSERGLGRPMSRFDRSIDVHVSSIRQKLGTRPNGTSWIQTIRGVGYHFVKE